MPYNNYTRTTREFLLCTINLISSGLYKDKLLTRDTGIGGSKLSPWTPRRREIWASFDALVRRTATPPAVKTRRHPHTLKVY